MILMIIACAGVAAAVGIGVAIRQRRRAVCEVPRTPAQSEAKGLAWVIGAFVICPCHLPITLGIAATLLAGTAVGAALSEHLFVAGALITVMWCAATWHGLRLIRQSAGVQQTSIKER
jgi:hypothetical protein